jgi:hypothetical protein
MERHEILEATSELKLCGMRAGVGIGCEKPPQGVNVASNFAQDSSRGDITRCYTSNNIAWRAGHRRQQIPGVAKIVAVSFLAKLAE